MPLTPEQVRENAYLDGREWVLNLDRKVTEADFIQMKQHDIDLELTADFYLRHAVDVVMKVPFMRSMKERLLQGMPITQGMNRVILNIMREQHNKSLTTPINDRLEVKHDCTICGALFDTFDGLNEHRIKDHNQTEKPPEIIADTGEAKAVIENTTSTMGLDLRNLPDGRYAAPDPSGKNDYIFLMVKRVRRTHNRDRRYIYGKIVTGNEVVVAGTIEVKIWSSDSKELIGEQKPGDVYRGQYEQELQLIMLMPEPWALLFGKLLHYCCRCGKALTDDISRQIGLGLECEKKGDYFRQPPKYTFIGTDRPDAEKADPNDQKYLSGEWRHYVKPKEPAHQIV